MAQPVATGWGTSLRHRRTRLGLALAVATLLACATSSLRAAPAPWYWWSSKLDGQRVCAQFMPAQGWRKADGPFDNPQCQSSRRALIPAR